MGRNFELFLWALKLGAPINLYLLARTLGIAAPDPHVVVPALILLGVSAFRCVFPNRYVGNVVFHDGPASSIALTRLLATFSEVAYTYQFAYVLRVLNLGRVGWVDALAWLMVAQVVVSQGFVWSAIATRRLRLYFYEELGWFVIFAANTLASAYLYATVDTADAEVLLVLNLVFGAGYLPWQVLHLRSLRVEAAAQPVRVDVRVGLRDAIHERNRRIDAEGWGGLIGLTWMIAYWATLIPLWVHYVAVVVSGR